MLSEEEDVKIESYIQRDVKSISVKDMRKLVPKLRIECFYTEQELSGKKKSLLELYFFMRMVLLPLQWIVLRQLSF